ncbi:MAG: acyltransferase family protein [Dysgonomonas sp.]
MRRYDVDCLRVIVFGLLIFYHVGMFFVPWDYHIKDVKSYEGLIYPMLFLNQWRLSILFVISGMGTYYALSKRNGCEFGLERIKRLFIPLIVGMILIVPPQVYFEWLDQGWFSGNYFDFWPAKAFLAPYPEGGISWHHLWFILYLLIFSLVLIPAFIYLKRHPRAWVIRVMQFFSKNAFGPYIMIIPLFIWQVYLAPVYPSTHALVGDWYNLINYCTLFFFGFLLISLKETFWELVKQNKIIYLILGVLAFSFLMLLWFEIGDFSGKEYMSAFVKVFNLWSWILAIFGYAATYLNKPSKALTYANESVYPLYILHQTIIVILGYYLKHTDLGFFPKFSLMVIGTFGFSWIIYEFGIRRYKWIRPLFGLKNNKE